MSKKTARPLVTESREVRKLLAHYHQLKAEIKRLEEEQEDLREGILNFIKEGDSFKYDSIYADDFKAVLSTQTNHYWCEKSLKEYLSDQFDVFKKTFKCNAVTFNKLSVSVLKKKGAA